MTQNMHNAVIHLGHQNGTVTLWTPNLPHPAVRLLAHLGPVVSASVDPSTGGRYMATTGQDAIVKVWDCRNWKGAVRQWTARGGGAELEWSQKGALAVASGGTVNVWLPLFPLIPVLIAPSMTGIHQASNPDSILDASITSAVHDTSNPPPPTGILALLPVSRCAHGGSCGGALEYPRARCW